MKDLKGLDSIQWVILDVDGVLTDGKLYYSPRGEEVKAFNVKDGLGIINLRKKGIKVAVISGRSCDALLTRLEEIGVDEIYTNRPDKGQAFDELYEKYGRELSKSVCVGDDLPDLELFDRCQYGVAVSDAVVEVREAADFILMLRGGQGAVRELCDYICKSSALNVDQSSK